MTNKYVCKAVVSAFLAAFLLFSFYGCKSPAGNDGQASPAPTAEAAAPAETPEPTEAVPTPLPTPDLGAKTVVGGQGHYLGVTDWGVSQIKPGEVWLLGSLYKDINDRENEGCLFDVMINFKKSFAPDEVHAFVTEQKREYSEAWSSPDMTEFFEKYKEWQGQFMYTGPYYDKLDELPPETVLLYDEDDMRLLQEAPEGIDGNWLVALKHWEGEVPQDKIDAYRAAIYRYAAAAKEHEQWVLKPYYIPDAELREQFVEYAKCYIDMGYCLDTDHIYIMDGGMCCRAFLAKEQIEKLPLIPEDSLYVFYFNEANFGGEDPDLN